MYWMYIRAAHGAVNEERFSGTKRTPNTWQIQWTLCHVKLDEGVKLDDIFFEAMDINSVPEYFVYEMSKSGLSLTELARKFGTTEAQIQEILDNQLETAAIVERIKEKDAKRGRPMEIV